MRKTLWNYFIEIALDIFNLLHNDLQQTVPETKSGRWSELLDFDSSLSRWRLSERDFHIATSGKAERGNDLWPMRHTTQHDDNIAGRSSHMAQRSVKQYFDRATIHIRNLTWNIHIFRTCVFDHQRRYTTTYRCGKVQFGPDREIKSIRIPCSTRGCDERSHVSRNRPEIVNGPAIDARFAHLFDIMNKEEHGITVEPVKAKWVDVVMLGYMNVFAIEMCQKIMPQSMQ